MSPRMKPLWLAGWIVGPVLGFLAGRLVFPPAVEPEVLPTPCVPSVATRTVPAQPPPTVLPAPAQGGLELASLREQLRQIVREELEAAEQRRAAQVAPRPEEEPGQHTPEPAPQAVVAHESGRRLVDAALLSRSWGEREASELRSLLKQMTEEQRAEILQRLLPAINNQELRVDVRGPPF